MQTYNMIADEAELKWFFDNIIYRPMINESYSAVFVSRHKKLTKEEKETFGLSRKDSEFLSTQTMRLKQKAHLDDINDYEWSYENFVKTLKRFNVDKTAYTTENGLPIPSKTLVILFYINPCDDIKVADELFNKINSTKSAIAKSVLNGKDIHDDIQLYRTFGNIDNMVKHLKAKCKGSTYWIDYDIDVPSWFKEKYYNDLLNLFNNKFHKGNYVIINTTGGYHILVKTSSIKFNPHIICDDIANIYKCGINQGYELYEKFEANINDSQIPGIPLPGTFQYDHPVTILNKEDFNI